jgi:hypothetical protein
MPSLISSTETDLITEIFDNIFDTRSRNIIIYKAPLKIPISNPVDPSNFVFGFGESQQQDAFTYQQVTGIYPAVIIYQKGVTIQDNSEIMSRISQNEVRIKVRKDARDYINNGQTEKYTFDDRTFYSNGEEIEINGRYWLFDLIATK